MKLISIVVVLLVITSCAQQKNTSQNFGVVNNPRDITTEEAVNFMNASEDYTESRAAMSSLELPEGAASLGVTNHPALVSGIKGKLDGFTIRAEESLLSVWPLLFLWWPTG